MRDPRYTDPGMSHEERIEKLQELTGCTDTKLKSLRRAARYAEKVLKAVDDGEIVFSHLVQFEESCVEQLEKHYPALLREFGKRKVREVLVRKAREKVLTSSRALMENVVPVVARAKSQSEKRCAERLLKQFVEKHDMTAEEVLKEFDNQFPTGQNDLLQQSELIADRSEELCSLIQQLPAGELASFPKQANTLKKRLTDLRAAISDKLKRIKSITG